MSRSLGLRLNIERLGIQSLVFLVKDAVLSTSSPNPKL